MNKELSLEEVKKIEIELLDYISKVCKENNLHYSLCYGTLLGAIRHKGFIPWDDDIDIILPRDDYNKLIKLLKDNKRYKLLNIYTSKDYFYPFAKLVDTTTILKELNSKEMIKDLGVNIDLFPIDGLGNNYKEANKLIKKLRFYDIMRTLAVLKEDKYNQNESKLKVLVRKLRLKLVCMMGAKYWLKKREKLVSRYSFYSSKYVGVSYDYQTILEKVIKKREFYKSYINVEFENKSYKCIKDYDIFLKEIYGDYMELPPIDRRVSNHNFKAYLK